MNDPRYKEYYDPDIDKEEMMNKLAANTFTIYQKTKSVAMISSRDLINIYHISEIEQHASCPNGGLLFFAFTPTPDRNDLRPPTDGVVRAQLNIGGWLLEPLGEN